MRISRFNNISENASSLKRRSRDLPPRKRILIVCEGEKTEPLYFNDLRSHKKLTTAEVEIIGKGSDPSHLIKETVKLVMKEKRKLHSKIPYDSVWCIFDRDDHEKVNQAINQAYGNNFKIAFSNPCFELWFLLHYDDSASERGRQIILRKLREHLPKYKKSSSIYTDLLPKQDTACRNAESLRQHHENCGRQVMSNPSTTVDQLVAELNALAERQR